MFHRSLNGSECTPCTAQYFCLVKSTSYALPPCTPLIKSLSEWFQLTRCRSGQPFSPTSKLNRPVKQLAPASTTRWCWTPNGIRKVHSLFHLLVSLYFSPEKWNNMRVCEMTVLSMLVYFCTTSLIFTKFSINIGRSNPYILMPWITNKVLLHYSYLEKEREPDPYCYLCRNWVRIPPGTRPSTLFV